MRNRMTGQENGITIHSEKQMYSLQPYVERSMTLYPLLIHGRKTKARVALKHVNGFIDIIPIRSIDSPHVCIYAEIRTRIPETIVWDYNFEPTGNAPVSFTVKSAVLKEAIDDLEWPGSSIQITLQPDPACVTFRGEGHGDLQIDFLYYANADLLIAFQCNQQVSHRYKYKFLRATTSNIPSTVLKDNRGSKLTIGRGGILKIQHLVSVVRPGAQHLAYGDPGGYPQPSRIAYIEFFVKPEEQESANDA